MFIYEKNKLNKKTGVVEQSLNVTFEGNKPVETPDVVITKDGVTGIKSDSNAYAFSLDGFPLTISSYSIDGEIVPFDASSGDTNLTFTKSVGFNVASISDSGDKPLVYISGVLNDNTFTFNNIYIETTETTPEVNTIGEYIIDMQNKVIHTPESDIDISGHLIQYKKIYGFNIGYHGG